MAEIRVSAVAGDDVRQAPEAASLAGGGAAAGAARHRRDPRWGMQVPGVLPILPDLIWRPTHLVRDVAPGGGLRATARAIIGDGLRRVGILKLRVRSTTHREDNDRTTRHDHAQHESISTTGHGPCDGAFLLATDEHLRKITLGVSALLSHPGVSRYDARTVRDRCSAAVAPAAWPPAGSPAPAT